VSTDLRWRRIDGVWYPDYPHTAPVATILVYNKRRCGHFDVTVKEMAELILAEHRAGTLRHRRCGGFVEWSEFGVSRDQ
jgi:hypothetical protein